MLEKFEVLLVIIGLLATFYFVISLGARSKEQNSKIKNYLFGVRILIIIMAIVALILWSFL
jgi:hypothetical protein